MQPLAFRLIAKAKCNDASRDSNTLETRKWQTLNAKDERDFTTVLFIPISAIGGEWDAHEGPSSPLGWLWKKLAGSYYCYTAKWLYLCRFKLWPSCCSLFFFFCLFFSVWHVCHQGRARKKRLFYPLWELHMCSTARSAGKACVLTRPLWLYFFLDLVSNSALTECCFELGFKY